MVHADGNVEAPRIVDGKPMHIVGISEVYAQQERSAFPDQWKRFAPNIGKIPGQTSRVAYGIMFDAPGGFEYITGVEVSGVHAKRGSHAVYPSRAEIRHSPA